VQKFGGPRIRLTARKRVPQIFEKFTWNSAQAKSASPSPIRDSTSDNSPIRAPICTPDPHRIQPQAHDPVREDPAQVLHTRDPRVSSLKARDLTRGHLDQVHDPSASLLKRDPCFLSEDPSRTCASRVTRAPPQIHFPDPIHGLACAPQQIHPFPNWVWTRNPNLGISSPSEARFRPIKRRYDQYNEEHYSGRIQILIFATEGFKRGKVLNQVKDFGKVLTILIQVVVIKYILVGIPTSIREGTIIHKHN
jgi:hypothetical protein